MKELYQRMKTAHEENGDFLIKLFGCLVTTLVIGMMGWVGISLSSMQITMAEVRTQVTGLSDAAKELKANAQNNVDKATLNDKMGEVYRRIEDHERRILFIERVPNRADRQSGNSGQR